MSADEFAQWLAARLKGQMNVGALAEWTDVATEVINGELRPCVIVRFESGDTFVLSVGTVAP